MTNSAQAEFIQSLNGELTPEQAAHLLEMGEGDTGAAPDIGGEPAASRVEGETAKPEGEASNIESTANAGNPDAGKGTATEELPEGLTPENAVILAKDGKHTISYDKLVEARQSSQEWKARAEAAQAELEALQAKAQARADAGEAPTAVDNQVATAQAAIDAGIDPAIFGDFSEEALAKGIQTLVDQRVAAVMAQVDAKLSPIEQRVATDATEDHYKAIYEAHPDADSIVESKELADWIASQPSFTRAGYQAVLEGGTTQEVIELFDSFKQATGLTQAAAGQPDPESVKAAAKAAIAKATPPVPASLSDFPGGAIGPGSRDEAMAGMTGQELLGAMENMTPEQIETYLNRQL